MVLRTQDAFGNVYGTHESERAAAEHFECTPSAAPDDVEACELLGEVHSLGRALRDGSQKTFGSCHEVVMPFGEIARRGWNF